MKNPNRDTISHLEELPNVGKAMAELLRLSGIDQPAQLIDKEPLVLYDQLCLVTGKRYDPCVIDVFMSLLESGERASLDCKDDESDMQCMAIVL